MGSLGDLSNSSHVIARVDHVLNELDRLARTDCSPPKFYAEVLGQLKLLLNATDCGLIVPVHVGRWSAVSITSPSFADEAELQFTSNVGKSPARAIAQWWEQNSNTSWLGRGLNGLNWSSGGIVVKVSGPMPTIAKELLAAITEMANSFQVRQELMQSESRSIEIRSVIGSLIASHGGRDADRLLVDGTRFLLDADRVSLVRSEGTATNLETLAISGQPHLDPKSKFYVALKKLLASSQGNVSVQQLGDFAKENGSIVAVAFPFMEPSNDSQSPGHKGPSNTLLLEWFDRDRYSQNASRVVSTLDWVTYTWLKLPRPKTPDLWNSRLVRSAIATALLAGIVLFFLSPTELTILAQGTLQPSEQRFVFAPADGYVDKIHIADGQRVQAGEIIVSLSSPQLQLQINQISAEIGIVDQKRDGLNLAINQLKQADDPANLTGSRLVGEVQELEAKRTNLLEQKKLLDREQERLQLRSPIDGNVIAWEVENYIENRPVRRGDTLLRIAALDKNWQIESTVVDWEAGYVTDAQCKRTDSKKPFVVEFVLASSPSKTQIGQVSNVSNTMREVVGSQQLDLFVSPELPIQGPRMGTSATVSIPCGQFPRWFVWTRSFLDAVRRRFWL